jgi:hypothetical protein
MARVVTRIPPGSQEAAKQLSRQFRDEALIETSGPKPGPQVRRA